MQHLVIIEVSRRHVHLSEEDYLRLFGEGQLLHMRNSLSQPGQFAALETVDVRCRGRLLEHVRVVGPFRSHSQIELSERDAHALDLIAPRRISGDIADAPMVELCGPAGSVEVPAIMAERHLHCDPQTAQAWNLQQGMVITIRAEGSGALIENVKVRIDDTAAVAVHLDEEEGHELGMPKGGTGTIIFK